MVVRLLVLFALDVLMSAGATVGTLWLNLGWLVALVPALVIGTRVDGMRGTAIAHAVVAAAVAAPLAWFLLHRNGVRLRPILPALARPFLGAAVAAGVCALVAYALRSHPALQLVAGGAAGMAVYVVVAVPAEQIHKLCRTAADAVRSRRSRSRG
jgi:PST family polysaccharide transporter